LRLDIKYLALYLVLPALLACSRDQEAEMDTECHMDISMYDYSFGIDHGDPGRYLIPGEQSNLSDFYLEEIREVLGEPWDSMPYVLRLCEWVGENFTFDNAGGGMIGIPTVDELFLAKTFYGCHSHALIISSLLRELGFPALMIETADVQWAYDYHAGRTDSFRGHVMSEIFVADKWILLDNDGTYVEDYVYDDPFISTRFPSKGLFVIAKGIDTWEYSHGKENFTHEKLIFFSDNIYCYEAMLNTVDYIWKP
jgi:hypothetical protein